MVRRFNWNAQAVPRCTAIRSDESVAYALLERCKCSVHADVEFITRDCFELLFGIVYVIDVDRPDAEVGDAAFDLIAQEGWSDAVATCHEICRVDDARVEVFSLDIIAVLVLAGWRRCFERQVTALGSNEDRVSLWCDLAEGTPARMRRRPQRSGLGVPIRSREPIERAAETAFLRLVLAASGGMMPDVQP